MKECPYTASSRDVSLLSSVYGLNLSNFKFHNFLKISEIIQKYITIFQSLPATPYFKMIDIWLFFSMNLMVVSVKEWFGRHSLLLQQVVCLIFHTYLEYVIQTVEKNEQRYQLFLSFTFSPKPKISSSNLKTVASVMSQHTLIRGCQCGCLPKTVNQDSVSANARWPSQVLSKCETLFLTRPFASASILKGQAVLSFRPSAEDVFWLETCFVLNIGLSVEVLLSS